jgi:hypothetical protein
LSIFATNLDRINLIFNFGAACLMGHGLPNITLFSYVRLLPSQDPLN